MSFNHGRAKPAQVVVFFKKTENITYPYLYFNNVPVIEVASQKHLGLNLVVKLTFKDQIHDKLGKSMKSVSLLVDFNIFYYISAS